MLRTPATALLAVGNMIVFVLMTGDQSGEWTAGFLVSWGANAGRLTFGGEPWRLVTAMFLHGAFVHIAGNMVCLLAWGSFIESVLGTSRFLLAYFVCGILANLASAWANPNVVSVGASGAIAGTLGLMVVIWLKGDARVSPRGLLANIALNTMISLHPSVDWVAHVVGFAAGIAIGPILFRDSLVQKPVEHNEPSFDQLGPIRRPAPSLSIKAMDFPKGTTVHRTRSRLVAILPDGTLIADDGAGSVVFDTARDYRDKMGDEDEWEFVRKF